MNQKKIEQIFKLKIEFITPVHIGDGDTLEPYEYFIDDYFYRLDINNFLLDLSKQDQDNMLHIMEHDFPGLRRFVCEKADRLKHIIYKITVTNKIKQFYVEKLNDARNQMLVSPFIRNMDQPYIPGSSIKGAIRTAVLFNRYNDLIHRRFRHASDLEKELLKFGEFDKKSGKSLHEMSKDPFRMLHVADVELRNDDLEVGEVDVLQKGQNNVTPMLETRRECTKSSFTRNNPVIKYGSLKIQQLHGNFKKETPEIISISDLFNSCREFSHAIIKSETEFFGHEFDDFYNELNTTNEKSFLLKIGWGSGLDAVSLNLKRDYKKVKTRRVYDYFELPLGWIEITPELQNG